MSNWRQILSWQTVELENPEDLTGWLVGDKSTNPIDYAVIYKVDDTISRDNKSKFWGIWRNSEQEALDVFDDFERHENERAYALFYHSDWKKDLIPIRKIS